MSTPTHLGAEQLAPGEDFCPTFALVDEQGLAVSLAAAGRSATLRLRPRGGTSSLPITRSTEVVGETAFPDGSGLDGRVQFLFAPAVTALWPPGTYDLEVVFVDTAPAPTRKPIVARGLLLVVLATTGPI